MSFNKVREPASGLGVCASVEQSKSSVVGFCDLRGEDEGTGTERFDHEVRTTSVTRKERHDDESRNCLVVLWGKAKLAKKKNVEVPDGEEERWSWCVLGYVISGFHFHFIARGMLTPRFLSSTGHGVLDDTQ
ncbi:hypothetical protein RUM43_006742 [Polyplax serrata]|uniref:Uncharacterized protein n=1 Tax=Polyplax serrata TaxID=468196 RepID=A0AAN8S529_POLSC